MYIKAEKQERIFFRNYTSIIDTDNPKILYIPFSCSASSNLENTCKLEKKDLSFFSRGK